MKDLLKDIISPAATPAEGSLLLRASLEQTGMEITEKQAAGWRTVVAESIAGMEWDRVVEDVRPFLERCLLFVYYKRHGICC